VRKLKEIEDQILEILAGKGNILENESAIATLNQSKVTSDDIKGKEEFVALIETLPLVAEPEIFGFHENANITKDTKETQFMFTTVLLTEGGGSGGGGGGNDAMISTTAHDILAKLPAAYDMEGAQVRYPVQWEQSMNTVLCQELQRFNNLTSVMKRSLVDVDKAVKGVVVMSGPLEKLGESLVYGTIPAMWKAKSYPSFKPLAGYVQDLLARLEFLRLWLDDEPPPTYWISAFFFQHAYRRVLTAPRGCLTRYLRQRFGRDAPHDVAVHVLEYWKPPGGP
jgi:dynein heavy chain